MTLPSRSEAATFVALEEDLYRDCARKLYAVSRSYLEQSLHVIRSCRELLSRVPTLSNPQKGEAIKLLRRTVNRFSKAVNAAAYVYIGHGPNPSVDQEFSDIAMNLSSLLQFLSMPNLKLSFDQGFILAKKSDTMKSKRIFVAQKYLIRRAGEQRRKYLADRFKSL